MSDAPAPDSRYSEAAAAASAAREAAEEAAPRPRGVLILAIALIGAGALLAAPAFVTGLSLMQSSNFLGGLLAILLPQAMIVGGIGIWRVEVWGVYVTAPVMLYWCFLGARGLVDGTRSTASGALIIFLGAGVLYYLTRPHVKGAFHARARAR